MGEPVTPWLYPEADGNDIATVRDLRPFDDPNWTEYRALPRADFDALQARLASAEREQAYLHERRMALLAEVERAERERDEARAALAACAEVLSGACMTKSALIEALERARAILKGAPRA